MRTFSTCYWITNPIGIAWCGTSCSILVFMQARSINNNQSQRQQQQITNHNHEDDMIMLKSLKETAEIIKAALQKKPNVNLRVHLLKATTKGSSIGRATLVKAQ